MGKEFFDDEYMNDMLLNPDLYGMDDENEEDRKKGLLSGDDIEDQDDFETWQRVCQ